MITSRHVLTFFLLLYLRYVGMASVVRCCCTHSMMMLAMAPTTAPVSIPFSIPMLTLNQKSRIVVLLLYLLDLVRTQQRRRVHPPAVVRRCRLYRRVVLGHPMLYCVGCDDGGRMKRNAYHHCERKNDPHVAHAELLIRHRTAPLIHLRLEEGRVPMMGGE